MLRIMRKVWIPTTVSNVKITCYYEDIVDINLSILKILKAVWDESEYIY